MLTLYNGSKTHIELYLEFKKRLGEKHAEKKFKNPFSYYLEESGANVSLWLLIIQEEVIATVTTKKQAYIISGVEEEVYFLQYPVSLGIVDSNYTMAAALLSAAIKKKFKYSFLLGMGGSNSKAARFFKSSRFVNIDLPFFIQVISWKSLILHNPISSKYFMLKNDLPKLSFREDNKTGLYLRKVEKFSYSSYRWKEASFSLKRTNDVINAQSPSDKLPFLKYDIKLGDSSVGGIILIETAPRKHKLFGNLNVWTILELEFDPRRTSNHLINKELRKHAIKRNIDIVLINSGAEQHKEFCKQLSWINIRSNFCLSLSPKLASKIDGDDYYITRIDGDGPINLGLNL